MTDGRGAPKVCIVNERFARKFFKDGLAVGRHIGMGGDPGTKLDIEIVGVVRDTKYESMRDEVPLEVYRPYHQMEFVIGMYAYVRTARQPEQAFSSIRQVVNNLDPNLPVFQMKTIEVADGRIVDHRAFGGHAVHRFRHSGDVVGSDRPLRRDGLHGGAANPRNWSQNGSRSIQRRCRVAGDEGRASCSLESESPLVCPQLGR